MLITLSLIFECAFAWWAAAARGIEPVILSFGAAFAAFGLNDKSIKDLQLFNSSIWTGPIDKNNKIMNESKKGKYIYYEKFLKD